MGMDVIQKNTNIFKALLSVNVFEFNCLESTAYCWLFAVFYANQLM